MQEKLGKLLEEARMRDGKSLEHVAAASRISPSYVRKLEQGRVKDPSPRVLRRVAATLGLPYLRLMRLAGYLDDEGPEGGEPSGSREETPIDDRERRAVRAFLRYLRDEASPSEQTRRPST